MEYFSIQLGTVIDFYNGTVPWTNPAARHGFFSQYQTPEAIYRSQSESLLQDLQQAMRYDLPIGTEVYCWLMHNDQGLLHRCTGKIVSLGSSMRGIAINAEPMNEEDIPGVEKGLLDDLIQFDSLCAAVFWRDGKEQFLSDKAQQIFGAVTHLHDLFAVASASKSFIERLGKAGALHQEIRLATTKGIRWCQIEARLNTTAGLIYFMAQDIQAERDFDVSLYRLKNYDELTELPNRNLLYQLLEKAQITAKKTSATVRYFVPRYGQFQSC
ncbi:hypothetical protein [Maribrevibacterium harenarium]|uniref:hypothetical protein n=1 Tax=Maribrevibacterium harenarium TaxID=2589817 RepID=UPI001F3B5718|nr:hypothetical protein [Maribrevibacterium harenarium]